MFETKKICIFLLPQISGKNNISTITEGLFTKKLNRDPSLKSNVYLIKWLLVRNDVCFIWIYMGLFGSFGLGLFWLFGLIGSFGFIGLIGYLANIWVKIGFNWFV